MSEEPTSQIAKRFPLCFPPGVPIGRYMPLHDSFDGFLRLLKLTPSQRDVVRALMQMLPFKGGITKVPATDQQLADLTRMSRAAVMDAVAPSAGSGGRNRTSAMNAAARFYKFIEVNRGVAHTKGNKGLTTVYDLAPLFRAFNLWRSKGAPDFEEFGVEEFGEWKPGDRAAGSVG